MSLTRKATVFSLLILFVLGKAAYAEIPAVTAGLNFLSAVQNMEGSWGNEASTTDVFRTTATVVETLQVLKQENTSSYGWAGAWLKEQDPAITDYLSERLRAVGDSGQDTDLLVSYINKEDKAWGGFAGYETNDLDTVLALQALKRTGFSNGSILQSALGTLLSHQNADGGFGFQAGDESNVYMTATVSIALKEFPKTTSITGAVSKATGFLRLRQNSDGGFGGSSSTVYETALAFLALADTTTDVSVLDGAVGYLTAMQRTDGSWDDDAYSTALALRAFGNVKPNPAITSNDIGFSAVAPIAGETITVSATIKNTGPAEAVNIGVHFYTGNPAAGGALIGEALIASISPHGSTQASISWLVSGAGSNAVYVLVDPTNAIDELDETDNLSSRNMTAATLPDLNIASSDISFEPEVPLPESPVAITATVRNKGETAAGNVSVDFYLGDPKTNGVLIGSATIGAIGAGGSAGVVTSGVLEAGVYEIHVVADKSGTITEADETNNSAKKALQVGGDLPELAVSREDISFSPANSGEGTTVTLKAAIHNAGEVEAESVVVRFFLNDPDAGGVQIGSDSIIPVLPARGEVTAGISWDSTGHAGSNAIHVQVDPQNSIAENEKLNNRAAKTLVVAAATGPDLTVSRSIRFSPAAPNTGDPLTITADIKNIGSSDASNVLVEFSLGDPDVAGSLIFGSLRIPFIATGETATAELTWDTTGRTGTFDVYLTADTFNEITETNETNNSAFATIKITGPEGPDLSVRAIETNTLVTDTQNLAVSGTVKVTIENQGNHPTGVPFEITAFEDSDGNGMLDSGTDHILGRITYTGNMEPGATDTMDIPLSGKVLFRDSIIHVMTDSTDNAVHELDETNNLRHTGQQCEYKPPVGDFNPVQKRGWKQTTMSPSYNKVMNVPMVARIVDTNSDGVIDDQDVPCIIFSTFQGGNCYSDGILRAVRADNMQELFDLTNPAYRVIPTGSIAVGDIDNDGIVEILAPKNGGGIIAFEHDGTFKWSSPYVYAYWGGPAIADLDGDGAPEIVVGATVLNNDGTLRWNSLPDTFGAGQTVVKLAC